MKHEEEVAIIFWMCLCFMLVTWFHTLSRLRALSSASHSMTAHWLLGLIRSRLAASHCCNSTLMDMSYSPRSDSMSKQAKIQLSLRTRPAHANSCLIYCRVRLAAQCVCVRGSVYLAVWRDTCDVYLSVLCTSALSVV